MRVAQRDTVAGQFPEAAVDVLYLQRDVMDPASTGGQDPACCAGGVARAQELQGNAPDPDPQDVVPDTRLCHRLVHFHAVESGEYGADRRKVLDEYADMMKAGDRYARVPAHSVTTAGDVAAGISATQTFTSSPTAVVAW